MRAAEFAAFTDTLGGGIDMGGNFLKGAVGSALVIAAGKWGVFRVREGERALKENKRALVRREMRMVGGEMREMPKIYMPGVHVVFPGLEHYKRISIQDRTDPLKEFEVKRPKAQWKIDPAIVWGVSPDGDNPYRALYKVDTIEALREGVLDLCQDNLNSTMLECSEELFEEPGLAKNVFHSFNDRVSGELSEWGVELRRLRIRSYSHSFGQMIVNASIVGQEILKNGVPVAAILDSNGHGELPIGVDGSGLHVVE